jgi:hypothetical protein
VTSQQRIDRLVTDTHSLVEQYRAVLDENERLTLYHDDVEALVAARQAELDAVENDVKIAVDTRARIGELLQRMVHALARFIEADLPFSLDERRARVTSLKKMLGESETSPAEKYRRVMEAYQIEIDYGRTLDVHAVDIRIADEARAFEVLRVGRIALLGSSYDRRTVVRWNHVTGTWEELPSAYAADIARALRIARREVPPAFVALPLSVTERQDR